MSWHHAVVMGPRQDNCPAPQELPFTGTEVLSAKGRGPLSDRGMCNGVEGGGG